MRLKLESPKLLSDIVTIISELVSEVRLRVNKDGMSLTALDPANVAMTYFKIPADLFSEFEVHEEEVLGINLENLRAILRRSEIGSALTLEKVENLLKIGISGRIKRDFTLALIDIQGDDKQMPSWEFKSVVKMDSNVFVDVIEDCSIVSDACSFIAEPNKFVVEAHGPLNSARAEFTTEEVEIYSDNSTARFSLEYLQKFMKGAKISSRVSISFSDNHPMRIDFPTGNVMLSFVLAPRIEQD
jgi:proliferating cell nuclear antigen